MFSGPASGSAMLWLPCRSETMCVHLVGGHSCVGPQSRAVWVQEAAGDAHIHMGHKPCDPLLNQNLSALLPSCLPALLPRLRSAAFQGIASTFSSFNVWQRDKVKNNTFS